MKKIWWKFLIFCFFGLFLIWGIKGGFAEGLSFFENGTGEPISLGAPTSSNDLLKNSGTATISAFHNTKTEAENSAVVVANPSPSVIHPFYRQTVTELPQISSKAALIADLKSEEIYFTFNADTRWPIASLTKLMTATVAIKKMDPESAILFKDEDFAPDDPRLRGIFDPGDVYSLNDLLHSLLISSSNESAEAIARFYGRESFLAEMNSLAREWGMSHTFYKDPSGLSAANQSEVQDLLRLSSHIYREYPSIFEITRAKRATITEIGSGTKATLSATHPFAGRSDFLGGKTGLTPEASENLLSIFSYGGRPVLVIVLGSNDRSGDTQKLLNWFKNDFSPSR